MKDAAQLKRLTADLRAVMGPEALIAIDQEGGAVVRSTWVPAPPAAMGLGAADDTGLAQRTGAAVARAVKALGFNWNFAPVLDLNNNPHNPVIAERSYGDEASIVTRLARAWMAGSQGEGVACWAVALVEREVDGDRWGAGGDRADAGERARTDHALRGGVPVGLCPHAQDAGKGEPTDSCNVGVPENIDMADRRYIIDPNFGAVAVFLKMGPNNRPDAHVFFPYGDSTIVVNPVPACLRNAKKVTRYHAASRKAIASTGVVARQASVSALPAPLPRNAGSTPSRRRPDAPVSDVAEPPEP